MKLGSSEKGIGIVCENKIELSMVVAAMGDLLDLDFWGKIEDSECIAMTVGQSPVYFDDAFDKIKDETTAEYAIETLPRENEGRTHKSPTYIVYSYGLNLKTIINKVISAAKEVSQKKPYKV